MMQVPALMCTLIAGYNSGSIWILNLHTALDNDIVFASDFSLYNTSNDSIIVVVV